MTLDSAALLAFIINGAAQTAVIAAGTAVALRLVRTATPCVKHRVAVVGLALCGAVPFWAWPATRIDAVGILPSVNTSALAGAYTADLIVGAYLTLVAWKVATLARAALAYTNLRRNSTPITDGAILASFQRFAMGGRDIRLCRSPRPTTPLVCGVARPTILVPDDLADCDPDMIDAVIAHECAHVARHDVLVMLTIEVLTAPFAGHPAVAALKRAAAKHREVACDEVAIERLRMGRTKYASLLLCFAERRARSGGALALGATTQLESRIRALLEAPSRSPVRIATQVLLSLCLVTTTAVAAMTAIAVDAGWRELSGGWTLDVDESQPRGQLPFRAAKLRIDATSDHVYMAQQRTRRNGVDEAFEIRRRTDDVPSDVTLPGGFVVRTRARWEGVRLVTNSSTPRGAWREHVEAIATGNRLVVKYENATEYGHNRYTFVYRRD